MSDDGDDPRAEQGPDRADRDGDGDGPSADDARETVGDDSGGTADDAGGTADDAGGTADDAEGTADTAGEATDVDPPEPTGDDGGRGFLGNVKRAREQLGEAKEAFANARGAGSLPTDEEGRVRIVCRRYAEKRAVPLDDLGRPACYDEDHPDCRGCLEDVRDRTVETW